MNIFFVNTIPRAFCFINIIISKFHIMSDITVDNQLILSVTFSSLL